MKLWICTDTFWLQSKIVCWKYIKCSVTCGMGKKTRSAICVHQQQIVNFSECKDQTKPKDIIINCSMDPCYRKVFLFSFQNLTHSSIWVLGLNFDWLFGCGALNYFRWIHSCSFLCCFYGHIDSKSVSSWNYFRSIRQIQYYMPMKFHRELSIVTTASIINQKD